MLQPASETPGAYVAPLAPVAELAAPSRMHAEDIQHLEYRHMINFVDNSPTGDPKTCKTCMDYIRDGFAAMPECILIEDSIEAASRITASKLESSRLRMMLQDAKVSGAMLMAIVFYTFDLCMITTSHSQEQCWYYVLNTHLRERNSAFLRSCHGYLYYLMTGLARLPPYCDGLGAVLFRGIDEQGVARAISDYEDGRRVHWSGFPSATPDSCCEEFCRPKGLAPAYRTAEASFHGTGHPRAIGAEE
eukprot:TRINITY_DN75863_c0_g1_i1.p1 TRINITY_DN75863_c0_g1~~TRINITY_DN75863_c0_g1_i1.p1  ORF type:complete len:281 (-),score=33.09 TRINITY_DN75863_c0_g1_i1:155-895(-)